MRRSAILVVAIFAAVMPGCSLLLMNGNGRNLGPASDVIVDSLDAMGDSGSWWGGRKISVDAVLTTYDQNGKSISRQHQQFDLKGNTLNAKAQYPGGSWQANVRSSGRCEFTSVGVYLSSQEKQRLCDTLQTILHRVRGPMNFLDTPARPLAPEPMNVAGERVIRVGMEGGEHEAMAYYFDAATKLLRFVTAGADQPGRDGTVTIYQYMTLKNGTAFPRSIRIVKVGGNVLIGDEPVMEVEFTDAAVR